MTKQFHSKPTKNVLNCKFKVKEVLRQKIL